METAIQKNPTGTEAKHFIKLTLKPWQHLNFFVQKLLYPFNLLIVEFLLQKIDNPFLKKTLVYFLKCGPYVFIWQFKKR